MILFQQRNKKSTERKEFHFMNKLIALLFGLVLLALGILVFMAGIGVIWVSLMLSGAHPFIPPDSTLSFFPQIPFIFQPYPSKK